MDTKIIVLKRFVLVVEEYGESTGLVSTKGGDDYIFNSEASVKAMAAELRASYPHARYTPYQIIPLQE